MKDEGLALSRFDWEKIARTNFPIELYVMGLDENNPTKPPLEERRKLEKKYGFENCRWNRRPK